MGKTLHEKNIENEAIRFAKQNKKRIAKKRTDRTVFPPEKNPVSVFMAGSPGAGKTEASIELLEQFSAGSVVRIDPDEIRGEFPGYNGNNAWLFQGAVSILVDRILDKVYDNQQSFLLDGTLSHYKVACKNIDRSIRKGRNIQVLYVYQEPAQAWRFVQAREKSEGRRIRKADFISQYFEARRVVNLLKEEFGKGIRVDLLMKNIDNSVRWAEFGVSNIDSHIPERYTKSWLETLITE